MSMNIKTWIITVAIASILLKVELPLLAVNYISLRKSSNDTKCGAISFLCNSLASCDITKQSRSSVDLVDVEKRSQVIIQPRQCTKCQCLRSK